MRPAILIHGPTASGKTQISIDVAKRLDGEIVNADSMQVYKGLRVITAQPSDEEMSQAPHHLFGYRDPADAGSAGSWLKDAKSVIRGIQMRGRVPIIIGGTGLHLLALVKGLSEIPPIPDAEALRRILTIMTRTGAVAGFVLVRNESCQEVVRALVDCMEPDHLTQVRAVSLDDCSSKLFDALREKCQNLDYMMLDPVHTAIVYEHCFFKKKQLALNCFVLCLINSIR